MPNYLGRKCREENFSIVDASILITKPLKQKSYCCLENPAYDELITVALQANNDKADTWQQRNKWQCEKRNFQVGDVVLLKEENCLQNSTSSSLTTPTVWQNQHQPARNTDSETDCHASHSSYIQSRPRNTRCQGSGKSKIRSTSGLGLLTSVTTSQPSPPSVKHSLFPSISTELKTSSMDVFGESFLWQPHVTWTLFVWALPLQGSIGGP